MNYENKIRLLLEEEDLEKKPGPPPPIGYDPMGDWRNDVPEGFLANCMWAYQVWYPGSKINGKILLYVDLKKIWMDGMFCRLIRKS